MEPAAIQQPRRADRIADLHLMVPSLGVIPTDIEPVLGLVLSAQTTEKADGT
jgi:hypothetical protein